VLESFRVVDCLLCGGVLKPDVVYFGETVPAERVQACFALVERSRALLVLGSSLTVMSGYRFVLRAAKLGIPVAIVNQGATRGDAKAALRLDAPLGVVLPHLAEHARAAAWGRPSDPGVTGHTARMRRTSLAASASATALAAVAAHDLLQKQHALLRNFPVVGRARKLLETIGPELRQYIIAGNNEERPVHPRPARWVYASSKKENNYFGFGTDNDVEYTAGYPIIKHRTFGRAIPPSSPRAGTEVELPCAKVLGAARGRAGAFRPPSVVNISAMSFGSLSGNAIEALNRGRRWPAACRTPARAGSRPTTATAVSWCSRSGRRTSAAATSRAASTSSA
jgi:hypothetical protein